MNYLVFSDLNGLQERLIVSVLLLSGCALAVLREYLRRDAGEFLLQTPGLLLKSAQLEPAVERLLPLAPDIRIELFVFLFQRLVLLRDGGERLCIACPRWASAGHRG